MRIFRPLLQATKLKQTTGLYGLPVHPNPRPHLLSLYHRIINTVERLPSSSGYRQSVVALTKQRLAVVEGTEDVASIERELNSGQIEELIDQAEDELNLIPKMAESKPWEALEEPAPPNQWEYFGKGPLA
ncbi:ETC complex I subunit conserved region-domain-containing protein [Phlyctochytrium arcticum]|nr:ETC complex I subunit conserved region-domain-containing protein [Phlyctochytrium arcticum]